MILKVEIVNREMTTEQHFTSEVVIDDEDQATAQGAEFYRMVMAFASGFTGAAE